VGTTGPPDGSLAVNAELPVNWRNVWISAVEMDQIVSNKGETYEGKEQID